MPDIGVERRIMLESKRTVPVLELHETGMAFELRPRTIFVKATGKDALIEAAVERSMRPENIKTEVKKNGRWVNADESPLQG